MSLSSDELWQRLVREGLATPEQCQQWEQEVLPKLPGTDANNGLKLLLQLIAARHLSKYQAKIIAGQASGPIRYGPWLVEHPVKLPMWQGWYEVRRGQDAPRWARPVSANELEQLRLLRPSLPRALKLSALQQDDLITGPPPELLDGTLLLFVASPKAASQSSDAPQTVPAEGRLLIQAFASQRCPPAQATQIAIRLAEILAGLHHQQIVHGRVFPDRIYLQAERVVLAIDPLCAATGLPDLSAASAQAGVPLASGLIGSQMQNTDVAALCAPELHLPESMPSMASDVFSLGCVWWWLLTGQPPPASQIQQAAQVSSSPPAFSLPADCSLPEPLWRCLQACLAHNPSSRFASAEQLHLALAVARRTSPTTAAKVAKPAAVTQSTVPISTRSTTAAATATGIPRRRRRRQTIPWLWPMLGGCGLLIGLLVILQLTGALQPSADSQTASTTRPTTGSQPDLGNPATAPPAIIAADPRSEFFEIVAARPGANQRGLWAPPNAPDPLPLDLLPPGGQLFLSLRPDQWPALELSTEVSEKSPEGSSVAWSAVLGEQITSLVQQLQAMAGVPLADIAQVTLAFYAAEQSGQPPRACVRFHLNHPKPKAELIAAWNDPTPQEVSNQQLWVGDTEQAYYVPRQLRSAAELDAQTVAGTTAVAIDNFSVGPVDMMREVAEPEGARGALLPHLEKLWKSTDRTADVSLLISTPFLFTDGRDLLNYLPLRLNPVVKQWLGGDVRGASMHVHWQPQWYLETRVVGTSDLDAGKIVARQQQQVQSLPANVEQWLVSHTLHPYWRALALRFPQMLRTFVDYSRFGVEHGTALMNSYLPSEGGTNLTLTSWIALQDYSTLNAISVAASSPPRSSTALIPGAIEAYLLQPIQLSFDQEPIEVALQMIAEEANANLPPGAEPLRFVLDGAAFGKAGITRNQQLSDFRIEQQSVRDALTEIARRGNPVTTVTDLRQEDQRLLWVVAPDPDSVSGASLISLTTRAAAKESGYELPREFAPPP